MATPQKNRGKHWASIALKLAITGALLWLIASQTDIDDLAGKLTNADPAWLILAFTLISIQVAINSFRWKLISDIESAGMSLAQAGRIYLESMFFNQALPSVIGGDALRIFRARGIGVPLRKAVNGVFLDRLVGLIGQLLIAIATYPIFVSLVSNNAAKLGVGLFLGAGGMGILVLLLSASIPEGWTRMRIVSEIKRFCAHARHAFFRSKSGPTALAIAIIGHTLMVLAAWALANAIGMDVSPLICFVIVPTALIISMAPITLAGWGLREGAMTAGFVLIGQDGDGGLAVSVLIGLILLAIGLVGGLVWLAGGAKAPDESEQSLETDISKS